MALPQRPLDFATFYKISLNIIVFPKKLREESHEDHEAINFRTLQEIQQDMIDKITDLNMLPK